MLLDWHGTEWVSTFHSVNVVSSITGMLSIGFELVAVGACLWVWWEQAQGRLSLEAACLATLTFVMLGSKVVSAQYLIWLMPMWALYRLRVSWLLAAAANLIVFPYAVSAAGSRLPARPHLRGRPHAHVLRPRRAHRGGHRGVAAVHPRFSAGGRPRRRVVVLTV